MISTHSDQYREAIANLLFNRLHNDVNKAVSLAAERIIGGAPAESTLHVLKMAVEHSLAETMDAIEALTR